MAGKRRADGPWFVMGRLEVTTTVFVTALFVLSMFLSARPTTLEPFWFVSGRVTSGQVWRLFTWPVAFGGLTISIWDFVAAGFFWYFGSQLEAELQRVRYLVYLGVLAALPAALSVPFGFAAAGLRLMELFVIVGWALCHRNVRFYGIIPAPVLAGLLALIELVNNSKVGSAGGVIFVLVGCLASVVMLRSWNVIDDLPQIPSIGALARIGGGRKKIASSNVVKLRRGVDMFKRSREFDKADERGPAPVIAMTPRDQWPSGPISQGDVDKLLDKIGTQGMESLTDDERRILDDASRRLRSRKDD